jgi:hypothetical protein
MIRRSVHKWKKAWVAPSGLQPESSYKVSHASLCGPLFVRIIQHNLIPMIVRPCSRGM